MFYDLLESIHDTVRKLFGSRLFTLSLVFMAMFGVLTVKLFQLQIIESESYQNEYVQMTEKTVTTPAP